MEDSDTDSPATQNRVQKRFNGVLGALTMGGLIGIFEGGAVALSEGFALYSFDWPLIGIGLRTAFLAAAICVAFVRAEHPARWAVGLTLAVVFGTHLYEADWVHEALPSPMVRTAATIIASLGVSFAALALFRFAPKSTRRHGSFALILAAALVWAFPPSGPDDGGKAWAGSAEDRPANIIFIVIDTLRADHLSAYGYETDGKKTSPVLDSIAGGGTLFRNAYAQAPWTRPSVASLMTGLYPQSHGVATPFDRLTQELPTLPTMLGESGYQCAAFSANPQVSPAFGFDNGFDYFWSVTGSFVERTTAAHLWDRGMLIVNRALLMLGGKYDRGIPDADADRVNGEIRSWLNNQSPDVPRFMYFHYLDPHDPYEAPENLLFGDDASAPSLDEGFLLAPQAHPPFPLNGHEQTAIAEKDRLDLLRRYDEEIRFVDDRIGKQLKWMEDKGHYRPGLDYLVITADHGEEFYDHNQWLHGRSEFQEMVHVPLIITGPGIPLGSVVEHPVQLIDLFPTVLRWIGSTAKLKLHGFTLQMNPLPGYQTEFGRRFVYSHRPRVDHPIDMIRSGSLKLIVVEDGDEKTHLLYDLDKDPTESTNLLADDSIDLDAELDALIQRLKVLQALAVSSGRGGAEKVKLSRGMEAQLRALGYLPNEQEKPGY